MDKKAKAEYVKKQGQFSQHHCHWPGCEKQVPPAKWGCSQHWFKLPKYLRDKIWQAYRPGQEKDLRPSQEYLNVAHEVQEWIRVHLYMTPATKEYPKPPWLFLDMSNLGWRAHYTTGKLAHNGKPTGVIFGILRDLIQFRTRFGKYNPVFCFDSRKLLRKEIYPDYKKRKPNPFRKQVHRQLDLLQYEVLPAMGFKNIFSAEGYEADDVIASIITDNHYALPQRWKCIIISSDQDLYQLLHGNVLQFIPVNGLVMTLAKFVSEKLVSPDQWPTVKAISGCKSDNIKGIKKVGETQACLWLKGEINKHYTPAHLIDKHWDIVEFNEKLVRLPFEGCPTFDLREDDVTHNSWKKATEKLGIRRLRGY